MKAEIYQWIRILATFYILFTAVLQLMPDKKYERYIRSFMGLLLIYMLCMPLFSFLRGSREMIGDFSQHYSEEVQNLEQKETQDLQGFYIRKGFRQELSEQITKKCEDAGIKVQETVVDIEGETISVVLRIAQSISGEQERRILDELRQSFGIEEQNIRIFAEGNDETAVDRDPASGTSSVVDRTSGIQKEQYTKADDPDG